MTSTTAHFAGVVLITVPTIVFGGARLLRMIYRNEAGYLDNPVRQDLFRAGHAHAAVLVIFALVGALLVDRADLSGDAKQLVRIGFALPPIVMPLGFFASVWPPCSEKPNRWILLVPGGALALIAATLTLGIGLLRV